MAASGAVFASASSYWVLLGAAVVGVVSVNGNEIGPFRAVEESALAGLVGEGERSDVFAWYVVVGTVGAAVGLVGGGWVVEACNAREGWVDVDAYRVVFWVYAAVGVVKAGLTMLLSEACEVHGEKKRALAGERAEEEERDEFLAESEGDGEGRERPAEAPKAKKSGFAQLSTKTRWMLLKLCALFAVDSLASGMVPYSLINFYMDRKFHLPQSLLGSIMSATWVMSSVGNIFASAIAKRIGLINTMVVTHLPSAVFLALIPAPNALWLTAILLVARGTLASMDQAPRSAFLSKAVRAEERTAVMGIVNVVKTLSQSGGPSITGILAGENRFWIAFLAAGTLKVMYDLGLLTLFLKVEKEAGSGSSEGVIRLSRRDSHDSTGRLVDEFDLETDEEGSASDDSAADKRRDSADLRA